MICYILTMFIKKTIKTDRSTGKKYSSYYLVESSRTVKGPRQRTLLYMGSEIGLPEDEHKFLAQCIAEIVAGQQSFLPYSENVAKLAQTYASQLIRHLSNDDSETSSGNLEPEFLSININSIEKS